MNNWFRRQTARLWWTILAPIVLLVLYPLARVLGVIGGKTDEMDWSFLELAKDLWRAIATGERFD